MFRFILRYVIFIVILATIQQRITLAYKALCANDRCDVPISEGETTQFYLNAEESFLKLKAHEIVKIFSKSKDKGQNGLLTIELNGSSGYAYSRFVKEIKVLVKSHLLKEIDLPDPKKVRDAAKSDSIEKTEKINVDQPSSSSQKLDILNDSLSSSVFGNVPITNENAITESERYTIIDGTKFPMDDFDPSSVTTAVPVISQTTQPYSREAVGDFQSTKSVSGSSASLERDDQGKTNFAQASVNPSLEHFESIQSSAVNNEGLNIVESDSKSEVSKEVDDEPEENEARTFGLFDKVAQTIGGIFGNKEVDNSETTSDDENEEDGIGNSEELPPNLMEAEFRPSPPELFASLESGSVAATPSNSERLDVITPVIPNSAASYVPEPSLKDEVTNLNSVQSSSAIDVKDDSYSKESKGFDIDLAQSNSWHGRKLNSETLASEISETKREIESPKVGEVPIRDTLEFENVRNDKLHSKPDKSDEEGGVGVTNLLDKYEGALVTEENQLNVGERKVDESKKMESEYHETVKTSQTDEISEDAPITNQKEPRNLVEDEKPEPLMEDSPTPTELPQQDRQKQTELPSQDNPKPTELPLQENPKPAALPPQDNLKSAEFSSLDNTKSTELHSQENPKPAALPPHDNPKSAEFSSQDNPKSTELPSQDNSKSTELPSQDNSKSTELPSQDNPKSTELPSQDNSKSTELPSQDNSKSTELPSQDNSKSTELPQQDNPKSTELHSQDNSKSTELPQQDNPKSTELHSQDNSKSAELPSQDNPKSAELPSQDNPKSAELPSQDNPKSAELPSQDNPKSAELPSQDNRKSTELPSQDNRKSTELPSQDNPKSTELPQQDNPKSAELPSQDNPKSAELPSQDNRKSTELPSQDNPNPTELKENSANPRELSKEANLKTPDIVVPKRDGELEQSMKETLPNELNESNTLNEAENITESVGINSSSNQTSNPSERKPATEADAPSEMKPFIAPIEDGKKLTEDELPKPVEEEIISKTTYPYPIPKENKIPYADLGKINTDETIPDLQPRADGLSPQIEPSPKIKSLVEGSIKNLDENPISPLDKSFETLFTIESDESEDVEKFEEALKNELFAKDDLEDDPESSRTMRGEVSNSPFFGGNSIAPPVPPYTNYDEYLQISKDKEPERYDSKISTEESKSDVSEDKAEDSVSSVESVTEPFAEALKNPSSDDPSRIDQNLPVVLKSYAQAIIDYIPDPLHSALMDLKSRGLSPGASFLTLSVGFLLVLLITLTMMIKRNNKEGHLLGVLCKTEEKVFKIGTENKILADELERAKTEVGELNENLVKNEEYLKILREELSQSKRDCLLLQESVSSLEEQLENSTEAGLELNQMLSEFLTSQNQNVTFTNAVEKLQTQLDGQRNTILTLQSTAEQHKEENRILQESAEEAKRISAERYALIRELEDELNETKNNLKNSEDSLSDLRSSSDQLEREKDQLLQEAIVWNERVQELMNQLEGYRRNQEDFQNVLDLKQKELDVLNEAIKKVNVLDDKENPLSSEQYEELVKKLVDVSQVSLDLKLITDERDLLKTQLDCEKEKGWLLETKISEIEKQMADAKDSYKAALAEKTEAQNKLEVLTNYFKEKEAQLQKELGAQEVMRQQKEYDADSSGRRLLSLMEENETFKSQIISLKKELEDTERSYKNLVATHEKKAHENWLAARNSERKLEEIKREAALLRQRLTLVERDSNESTNSNELVVRPLPKKLIARNGDITLIEQDAGSDLMDASMELDSSKAAQFRPLLLPADRPLPPPPAPPPFPMPPFGMPPMPPPPGGPFGVPHPPMMPFHHPDPWRFGHPGMDYEDRVSSRGGRPLSPHSSFSNASRDSRLSSPPPERRRDMFSPNRRMPSSRDSNSPPHLPNFHDLPPHMRGPNFPLPPPPPPHHLGPPRGLPPPLPPSHYDRNSPFPPAHGMRNDPHPHLYNDTPPDVRRTDLVSSSPRGNSTQDRDPSKKSSTAV